MLKRLMEFLKLLTEYTEFQTVLENLKNAGYQYEDAEITMIPEKILLKLLI